MEACSQGANKSYKRELIVLASLFENFTVYLQQRHRVYFEELNEKLITKMVGEKSRNAAS